MAVEDNRRRIFFFHVSFFFFVVKFMYLGGIGICFRKGENPRNILLFLKYIRKTYCLCSKESDLKNENIQFENNVKKKIVGIPPK
ncbi:hypothetical protein HanXRQr2_Chr09g0362311 [Helianthus annuus]|uniref:Uncharacterized protein n=1 Tax=Helianthus annuus TaxID=4232 RepID=A0A9K3I2D9_HELAN|nr:hypothetical protein HanXRQr2_Chr09g0362311 [Helianthus annuus]